MTDQYRLLVSFRGFKDNLESIDFTILFAKLESYGKLIKIVEKKLNGRNYLGFRRLYR